MKEMNRRTGWTLEVQTSATEPLEICDVIVKKDGDEIYVQHVEQSGGGFTVGDNLGITPTFADFEDALNWIVGVAEGDYDFPATEERCRQIEAGMWKPAE